MRLASDRTLRLLRALFGIDPEDVARRMAGATVALVADKPSPADEIALALCATLLLRLDAAAPVIVIDTPRARTRPLPGLADGPIVDALASAHAGFDSVERLSVGRAPGADLTITFGSTRPGLYVGSSGWAAFVGDAVDGPTGNEIGAAYAGTLAAAEAFKTILRRAGIGTERAAPWRGAVSLWDFSLTPNPGPALPDVVDLTGHAFVGAGGVATACAWVLALVPRAGDPRVVDFDSLDEPNLNRHLSGGFLDLRIPKAQLMCSMLESPTCRPVPRLSRWQDLAGPERSPQVAVVSVDDDPTRRDLALDMPRHVINAGTGEDGVYRLSVHGFADGACLSCLSRGGRRFAGVLESVASAVGLAPDDLGPYVRSHDPLPAAVIERMTVAPEVRELLAQTPGREFLEAACAHVRVAPAEPAVSAPMLSAAPGVLLAAEIAKAAIGALDLGGTEVRTSILSGPHRRWMRRRAKLSTCECTDDAYVDYYREKWGLGGGGEEK
jgi:hypothetical protein